MTAGRMIRIITSITRGNMATLPAVLAAVTCGGWLVAVQIAFGLEAFTSMLPHTMWVTAMIGYGTATKS